MTDTKLATFSICGLNVAASNTTFSNSGAPLCRACANHNEILASGQRARDEAAGITALRITTEEGAREAERVARALRGIEVDNITAVEAGQVAGASTFVCVCGQSFGVERGTKCYDRRIRCDTCAPPFQEAVAAAAAALARREMIQKVIFGVILAALFLYFVVLDGKLPLPD